MRLSREPALAALVLLAACAAAPQGPAPLDGTAWRLVRFQGGDGATLTPDDRSKYTLDFGKTGILSARVDCNRGRGSWSSRAPGQLRLSLLALTRAACPPGSIYEPIARQYSFVRSYTVKDGRLYLTLTADGGTYEFEPFAPPP